MKVLELKKVNKIYDGSEVHVHAVNDVSLDFREAEFAAIVGPSGSGKTTLLNLIGGLDMPTSGEIIIDGTNLSKLKSSKLIDFRMRNIGFVFQEHLLIPYLTVSENVFLPLLAAEHSKEEISLKEQNSKSLMKKTGIFDLRD